MSRTFLLFSKRSLKSFGPGAEERIKVDGVTYLPTGQGNNINFVHYASDDWAEGGTVVPEVPVLHEPEEVRFWFNLWGRRDCMFRGHKLSHWDEEYPNWDWDECDGRSYYRYKLSVDGKVIAETINGEIYDLDSVIRSIPVAEA